MCRSNRDFKILTPPPPFKRLNAWVYPGNLTTVQCGGKIDLCLGEVRNLNQKCQSLYDPVSDNVGQGDGEV